MAAELLQLMADIFIYVLEGVGFGPDSVFGLQEVLVKSSEP
jgi:hypothetical protein